MQLQDIDVASSEPETGDVIVKPPLLSTLPVDAGPILLLCQSTSSSIQAIRGVNDPLDGYYGQGFSKAEGLVDESINAPSELHRFCKHEVSKPIEGSGKHEGSFSRHPGPY